MSIKAKLFMWDIFGLWVGRIAPSNLHQHHALQLTASGDGCCGYRLEPHGGYQQHPAFVFDANVRHQIRVESMQGITLYVEPYSSIGEAIRAACFPNSEGVYHHTSLFIPPTEDLLTELTSLEHAKTLTHNLLVTLTRLPTPSIPLDARIQTVIAYVQRHLSDALPIETLAAQVHLSDSRLMHLFNEQVGMPIRRYVLWRRIIQANYEIAQGHSLTESAHNAGFADAAHMTRAFRSMIGHPPSTIYSRFVQAYFENS